MAENSVTPYIDTVISFVALLISICSAWFAKKASFEAKKANKITLHFQQKEIYEAFIKLKQHMTEKAESANFEEVTKFYRPSQDAKMYFSDKLAEKIKRYFNACEQIARISRHTDGGFTENSLNQSRHFVETERDLSSQIESEMNKLLNLYN